MSLTPVAFGAIISNGLLEDRAYAESLMLDTCTITRAGVGQGPFNDVTGQYDPPARVTVYAGKCRIQVTSIIANSTSTTAGEREITVQGSELQLPVIAGEGDTGSTGDVSIKDVAHIDTCVLDPELAGREFTISARHEKSQATSRRHRVTEATG